jgi:hypothetical protein
MHHLKIPWCFGPMNLQDPIEKIRQEWHAKIWWNDNDP